MDVPTKHLNLFKSNPPLDLNSLSLVVKGNPCCLNLSLQYSPYSVVYDPTAFMACKLVIVAWLKAYGAATKPRAPYGTAATCDAARHALVSRLLTKYLYQVTPPYCFCYKYSSLKYSGVQTGNPQRVDAIVFSQSKQEEVVLEEERMTWS